MQPQTPPQMSPQGMPAHAPTVAPQHEPSGRIGQEYNPQILAHIEKHLTQLPSDQSAFLAQYMSPELAVILGIVIGKEAYDYFSKLVDPQKMLTVQPRPEQENPAQQPAPKQAAQAQPAQSAPQQAAPQPKASMPAKSIMGI